VLDDARPVTSPPHCPPLPYRQIIVFGYRAGPVVTAQVRRGVCSSELVTVGSRSAVSGSPLRDALFFYTSRPPSRGCHKTRAKCGHRPVGCVPVGVLGWAG
jgi:hypothetical protein